MWKTSPPLSKILLPFSGKKVRKQTKWQISRTGAKLIPPDSTMEIWLEGDYHVVPFIMGVHNIIAAVKKHAKNDMIIIDYRHERRSKAVVVCHRKK